MIVLAALLSVVPCCYSADSQALVFRKSVVVHDGRLKFDEVADLSVLPPDLRERAAGMVLVRFATGHRPATLSNAYLSARARGQLPALAPWLNDNEAGVLTLTYAESVHPALQGSLPACLRAMRPIPAGSTLRDADFEEAPCNPAKAESGLVYDRQARSIRVGHDLAKGALVARYAGYGERGVRAGDRMMVEAGAGAVRIEREAEALQSARVGERLFVKTLDGEVLTVELRMDEP